MKKNLKSELVLTLQRRSTSKDDSFSTYKEWTKSCSGTGSFLLEKKPTVTKGYDYRLRVVVKVYSGSKLRKLLHATQKRLHTRLDIKTKENTDYTIRKRKYRYIPEIKAKRKRGYCL